MAMTPDNLVGRLRQAVREDPKKAGFLGALVLVMLLLWGRVALTGKNAPSPAAAEVNAAATGSPAARAADNPVRPGFSEHAERLSEWTREPVKPMRRNLFAVNLTYYRRDGSGGRPAEQQLGFWEELAKSREAKTDQKKARQILVENLQLQASQIRLQSTMMGANPQAMVNGTLVGVGDVVAVETAEARTTFRVLKIEARGMIVEHEGIKLAISMN